jgi:hypothetical protein
VCYGQLDSDPCLCLHRSSWSPRQAPTTPACMVGVSRSRSGRSNGAVASRQPMEGRGGSATESMRSSQKNQGIRGRRQHSIASRPCPPLTRRLQCPAVLNNYTASQRPYMLRSKLQLVSRNESWAAKKIIRTVVKGCLLSLN